MRTAASLQLNPILVKNVFWTLVHPVGVGNRVPDPEQDDASFRPQRNVLRKFNALFTDVWRMTALAAAIQKSALDICEYFCLWSNVNGHVEHQIEDNPLLEA
jgi:hypothetical protein